MSVKVIGLNIAKHVFQVDGADASGRTILKKRLRREQVTMVCPLIFACYTDRKTK